MHGCNGNPNPPQINVNIRVCLQQCFCFDSPSFSCWFFFLFFQRISVPLESLTFYKTHLQHSLPCTITKMFHGIFALPPNTNWTSTLIYIYVMLHSEHECWQVDAKKNYKTSKHWACFFHSTTSPFPLPVLLYSPHKKNVLQLYLFSKNDAYSASFLLDIWIEWD